MQRFLTIPDHLTRIRIRETLKLGASNAFVLDEPNHESGIIPRFKESDQIAELGGEPVKTNLKKDREGPQPVSKQDMPATSKLDREFKLEVPLDGCGSVSGRRYRFERSGARLMTRGIGFP